MSEHPAQPKLGKKLSLHKETLRSLTDTELTQVEGGFVGTVGCPGETEVCGPSISFAIACTCLLE
jgi:hypothetical protein